MPAAMAYDGSLDGVAAEMAVGKTADRPASYAPRSSRSERPKNLPSGTWGVAALTAPTSRSERGPVLLLAGPVDRKGATTEIASLQSRHGDFCLFVSLPNGIETPRAACVTMVDQGRPRVVPFCSQLAHIVFIVASNECLSFFPRIASALVVQLVCRR